MTGNTNEMAGGALLLREASELISKSLKAGAGGDPSVLDSLAEKIFSLDENKPEQLRLLLDIVRFFYLSGKPDFGLKVALKARNLALEVADSKSTSSALMLVFNCINTRY
jgi:hypothetical protein